MLAVHAATQRTSVVYCISSAFRATSERTIALSWHWLHANHELIGKVAQDSQSLSAAAQACMRTCKQCNARQQQPMRAVLHGACSEPAGLKSVNPAPRCGFRRSAETAEEQDLARESHERFCMQNFQRPGLAADPPFVLPAMLGQRHGGQSGSVSMLPTSCLVPALMVSVGCVPYHPSRT